MIKKRIRHLPLVEVSEKWNAFPLLLSLFRVASEAIRHDR
jgi:hypothetical protein